MLSSVNGHHKFSFLLEVFGIRNQKKRLARSQVFTFISIDQQYELKEKHLQTIPFVLHVKV